MTEIISTMTKSPADFLKQLLIDRGLKDVTGEALYTYHLTEVELANLRMILRSVHERGISTIHYKAWCACFVLWGAEWYRREYDESIGWSWSGIWQALGFKYDNVELAKMVSLGLEGYWERPLKGMNHDGIC